MTALAKAIAMIEREAATNGGLPESIDLTLYPDAATFARFHGGSGADYLDHVEQRAALIEWCRARGIEVRDHRVTATWPDISADRAEKAAKAARRPYRLGLSIGGLPGSPSTQGIGWMVVWLDDQRQSLKGEE